MRHLRTEAEIAAGLLEQRQFLRSSCAAYDAGHFAEAKRIAVAVSVLVHDSDHKGARSSSILQLAGLKHRLLYRNSARPINAKHDVVFAANAHSDGGRCDAVCPETGCVER